MDPTLKKKITDKLRKYFNREPLEHEIINAQNDSNLMNWITQDDAVSAKTQDDSLRADVVKLKKKAGI